MSIHTAINKHIFIYKYVCPHRWACIHIAFTSIHKHTHTQIPQEQECSNILVRCLYTLGERKWIYCTLIKCYAWDYVCVCICVYIYIYLSHNSVRFYKIQKNVLNLNFQQIKKYVKIQWYLKKNHFKFQLGIVALLKMILNTWNIWRCIGPMFKILFQKQKTRIITVLRPFTLLETRRKHIHIW